MLDTLFRLLSFPILLNQARWVWRNAHILSEASGPRSGIAGAGRPLRLLLVGDSSCAGVGVDHQDKALSGQLVNILAQTHQVHWSVFAKSGRTTRATLDALNHLPREPYHIAVIALGVNDVTRMVPAWLYRRRQRKLWRILKSEYGVAHIFVSGLPPMHRFPLLPNPLRWTLGRHAQKLDATLRDLVSRHPEVNYVPMTFPDDRTLLAVDGYHPGAQVYSIWARRIITRLQKISTAIRSDAL